MLPRLTEELPQQACPATYGGAVERSLRIKELEEKLRAMQESLICALNQVLDLKDLNTGVHSTRLAEWGVRVARAFGASEDLAQQIEFAALVHDVGKVGIPDAILNKAGRLTDEERELMKKHPEYGWTILRLFPSLEQTSLFVLHHHEGWDGSGYPGGLQGREIPIGSRIVCVIDAFDAMVSSRCYRAGLPVEEAVRRLRNGAGTQFDPEIVEHFLRFAIHDLPEVARIAEPTPGAGL